MGNPRDVGYTAETVHRTGSRHAVSCCLGNFSIMRNVTNLFDEDSWSGYSIEKARIPKIDGWLCNMIVAVHRNTAEHHQKRYPLT